MEQQLEHKRKCLLTSIMKYLSDEVNSSNLTEEKKESLDVAIQCIETAYSLDAETRRKYEKHTVDLLSLINVSNEDSAETQKAAEHHKNAGNEAMKGGAYDDAIKEYTKAIQLNPSNAVYYCNRAAAYSRLERHQDVIRDCERAITLDPTYGKAYGRLGNAYSSLNMHLEAKKAFETALKYDPNNALYETNLKLAQDRMVETQTNAPSNQGLSFDISQIINNESFTNMARQILNNPEFSNVMSRMMSMSQTTDMGSFSTLLQAGQSLASQMESTDPNFVENLRRTFSQQQQNEDRPNDQPDDAPNSNNQ